MSGGDRPTAFDRLRQLKAWPAEKVRPGSEPEVALCALADYKAGTGDLRRAIDIYEELLRKVLAYHPRPETSLSDATDMSRLYASLAAMHRRAGQMEPARTFEARRLELWQQWNRQLPGNNFVHRQLSAVSAAAH